MSVVIPTFGRPRSLMRCLRALEAQEVPAREVIVVGRRHDVPTREALERLESPLPLSVELIDGDRQSEAMNVGVVAASSPIVAMTDDDAAPRSGWIAGLELHHADPTVGAVGGRDLIHFPAGTLDDQVREVGVLTWYGRCIGNHHLGAGPARNVEFLKGVNLSFRRDLWQLDERLRGTGIQTHWEMDVTLGVRRRGLRVVYDPALVVDHYPAARVESDDRRAHRTARSARSEAFNQTLALLKWRPMGRGLVGVLYGLLVGTTATPGLGRSIVALGRRDLYTARLLRAAVVGHGQAVVTLLRAGQGLSGGRSRKRNQ